MIIVGIDPTTGSRSSLGFCVVDVHTMQILDAKEFQLTKTPDLRKRLKQLAALLAQEFKKVEALDQEYMIVIETTVMQGIGGQSLQRAIGAIMTISPSSRLLEFVYPMSVKKYITGEGKGSDKKAIAEGLKKFFPNNELLFQLTASSRYDTLDAIAIALTGYELHVKKSQVVPNTKSSKTVKKGVAKP